MSYPRNDPDYWNDYTGIVNTNIKYDYNPEILTELQKINSLLVLLIDLVIRTHNYVDLSDLEKRLKNLENASLS
ncbi:MAG: hypothetical protein ACE5H1_01775 [Thermodesulfobacteriota bacterium]